MRKISLDMFIYVFLFHDNVILTIRIFLLAVIFSRYQNNLFMYAILLVHLCVFLFYTTRLTSCRLLLAINLILVSFIFRRALILLKIFLQRQRVSLN